MFTLFAAQLSVDCFGTCGTSCVRKRSHWMCKSTVKSRLVFGAVDLKTSRLRPRQDAYVHHVPQYTSGFHESLCEGRAAVTLAALCPRSGREDRHAWPAFWSWMMPIIIGAPWKRSSAARGIRLSLSRFLSGMMRLSHHRTRFRLLMKLLKVA